MRIAVVGATGNIGSSVVAALSGDPRLDAVVGIARRRPQVELPKVTWRAADVRRDPLEPLFVGADAVISLAWLIQPSKRPDVLRSVNVDGTRRVLEAAAAAGVPAVVYSSSVGAYSAGDGPIAEAWPTEGIPTCSYSRDKAAVERMLDRFQDEHPGMRIVRLRPALVFKRSAGAEITRYFLGPGLVGRLLPRRLPAVPFPRGLRFQAVHSHDLASAFAEAALGKAAGAFNIAADPVIDADTIREAYGLRTIEIPPRALRAGMAAAWRLGLQPTDPSWLDMAMGVPVMDSSRARSELGWAPRHTATEALSEVLGGVRAQSGMPTPVLRPR
jgi:UDP-glucose 4-epimerase